MKKQKTVSLILAVMMVLSLFPLHAGAVKLDDGVDKMKASFISSDSSTGYDYLYFSPVKENDTTKYPLMIWLHGKKSGTEPGSQLQWYEFCNWASEEYQARFQPAGGCFLYAPRAVNIGNNWDATQNILLKSMIDEFISANKDNIDMSRIYIGGYSTGGIMVWSMLSSYPDFFAAGIPAAALTQPATTELELIKDTSVWIFCADNDFYVGGASSAAMQTFGYLSQVSNRRSGVRITRLSDTVLANGSKKCDYSGGEYKPTFDCEHYVWEAVTYDMHMSDRVTPYANSTTLDGNENTITFENPENGVISWLSKQTKEKQKENGRASFWDVLKSFFKRIIGTFAAFFGIKYF